MATDLKTAKDHPANILRDNHTEYGAAEDLRDYEEANDVTFAALDNQTLQRIREAYEGVIDDEALIAAVRDLLGLDD